MPGQKVVKDQQESVQKEQTTVACFSVENQEFGILINQVKEIIPLSKVTPVINTPDIIEGVINLRGVVIMVVNLRAVLGFDKKSNSTEQKILITEIDELKSGFLVDRILNVSKINVDQIDTVNLSHLDQAMHYISGVIQFEDRGLAILDSNKILNLSDIKQFE